ncbi:MAG: AraC family transcriptional regulator [Pseudoclavibacter sp.]
MGIEGTLDRFRVTHTRSVDEARQAVADVYLANFPHVAGTRLNMRLNAWGDHDFTLGWLTYGAGTRLEMPEASGHYHVNLTTRGTTHGLRGDGAEGATSARRGGLALMPNRTTVVDWAPGAEQLIIRFSRSKLERFASDLTGVHVDAPIEFSFEFGTDRGRADSALASAEFLAHELDRADGIADNPILVEQLESFVMSNVLYSIPNSLSERLHEPAKPAGRGRLDAVIEYMHDHAELPLAPADLARIGHMSIRSLHATFQREFGTSPIAYLRRIRLDRVRDEFMSGHPSEVRVAEVAYRWGFSHPSRFASMYREAFGELPSETLQAHRGDL